MKHQKNTTQKLTDTRENATLIFKSFDQHQLDRWKSLNINKLQTSHMESTQWVEMQISLVTFLILRNDLQNTVYKSKNELNIWNSTLDSSAAHEHDEKSIFAKQEKDGKIYIVRWCNLYQRTVID